MPQSLANLQIHLVFSTKNREPFIRDEIRDALHAYMATVLADRCCLPALINSVCDHVHILFRLPRTAAVCDIVEDVKRHSSRWMKTQGAEFASFAWQGGYSVFSVSPRMVERTRTYIMSQSEHHRNKSFQEEYRNLLEAHGIAYDERYVWD